MVLLGLDTRTRKVVFFSYLGLWCALRVHIYASQHGATHIHYNPAALLIVTTLLKLGMSCVSYFMFNAATCVDKTAATTTESKTPPEAEITETSSVTSDLQLFLRYFFPAASYVVYDNMIFFCLKRLDPVTYVILMQFRLPVTGLTWQAVFGKKISGVQWLGLGLIMLACIIQASQVKKQAKTHQGESEYSLDPEALLLGFIGCAIQIGCGVFSSVYNEFMLKKGDISLHLQNVFMYTHSLICNLVWIVVSDQVDSIRGENLLQLFGRQTFPIAVLLALIGLATSVFLKYLDSVRKAVASAMEMFGDALLSWFFFGIAVMPSTFGAIMCCGLGIVVCSFSNLENPFSKLQKKPQ